MPSLNLDLGYFDHPKTRRLIGLLGRGAEVLPIRLWCYCGRYHSRDGSLAGYSAQEIESIVGWWGKPGEMLQAFLALVLLEESPDGYVVHDWVEHAGHFEVYRARAKFAAAVRHGATKVDLAAAMDARSMLQAGGKHASSIAPAGQGRAGNTPPTPPLGGRPLRITQRLARTLVGAHPPGSGEEFREVDEESPAWVRGVQRAVGHAARPELEEDLEEAYWRWKRGTDGEAAPERWEERVNEAIERAVAEDRRLAGGGGRG